MSITKIIFLIVDRIFEVDIVETMKSIFDSGHRTEKGLPLIPDIIKYLEFELKSDPNKSFSRLDIHNAVIGEFNIPSEVLDIKGDSQTPLFQSRINFIIADAVQGEREDHVVGSPITGEPWIKRIGLGLYQHISGPNATCKFQGLPRKQINEAVVSVKILKNLGWNPERIISELHTWSDDVVEAAIQRVFKTP